MQEIGIFNINCMDSSDRPQVVTIFHPQSATPQQITAAICKDLQTAVTPSSIVVKEKDNGVLAYIELPASIGSISLM